MNLPQLLDRYDKFCAEQREVLIKKNSDYAKEGDVFHNFKTSAQTTGITPAQGCLNQLCIKTTRLGSLMAPGKEVQNEPVLDSSEDAFVYAFLLHEIILEGQEAAKQIQKKHPRIETRFGIVSWPENKQIFTAQNTIDAPDNELIVLPDFSVWSKRGNITEQIGKLIT